MSRGMRCVVPAARTTRDRPGGSPSCTASRARSGHWAVHRRLGVDHARHHRVGAAVAASRAGGGPRRALVGTTKHMRVTLASAAELTMVAEPAPRGELDLSPQVTIEGRPIDAARVRPVAHSGIYAFDVEPGMISLTLAPLALGDAARALLDATGSIRVPASESEEFVRDHLPRIARQIEVVPRGGLALPARRAGADRRRRIPPRAHRSTCAWRGSTPARPVPVRLRCGPGRDEAAETDLRARADAAWRASGIACAARISDAARHRGGRIRRTHRARARGRRRCADRASTASVPRYRELTGDPHVTVSTVESTDPDWFDLGVIVTIDGRTIPFAPLFTALTRGRAQAAAQRRALLLARAPVAQRLRDLIEEAGELAEWETGAAHQPLPDALWADFEDWPTRPSPPCAGEPTAEALRDVDGSRRRPLPAGLTRRAAAVPARRLRLARLPLAAPPRRHPRRRHGPRQDAADAGADRARARSGGDAAVPRRRADVGPVDLAQRGGTVRPGPARRGRRRHAREARDRGRAEAAASADVVITSYTLLRLDEAEFAGVEWAALVLDEAQFVKNSQTKAAPRRARSARRVTFAITGTPMENSLTELWALLSLDRPRAVPLRAALPRAVRAADRAGQGAREPGGRRPYRAARLARLRRRIRPLVLRRTKELVAADLPPKQEQEVRIELGARPPGALRRGAAAGAAEGARAPGRPRSQPVHRVPLAHAAAHAEPRARCSSTPTTRTSPPSKLDALLEQLRRDRRRGSPHPRLQPVHVVPRARRHAAGAARHPARVPRRLHAATANA